MTPRTPRIQAWTRKHCDRCRRDRTHYSVNGKWHCIGKADFAADIVTPCGKEPLKVTT